ncbi:MULTISPECIES: envelope stress response membrane protein PspB [unclassified Sphingomonas]|uniref:envelope stress response membrane protein PspB n=1 Tax=unclassified Sphingomonas TaxID=196159 RepID=UPI001D122805|nr:MULTISPECIES: envelope stress response membrane protein PspB [unclassified Sphingomonas]MCC2979570.1 envelope stress response membrane protein PspB [Sphingomonas sp. IC4-52]MCD2315200.1 envelope stress response membrane protein PspB [Sphingomonas sp. IC-11]
MEDVLVPVFVVGMLFIGLPWLIMHYVTKWKQAPGAMTTEDEALLDELHSLAKRLEDRVNTVERIVAADNPDFRPGIADYRSQPDYRLEDRNLRRN